MLMLYFSGTGNSKYIARRFSARMGTDCHSIEETVDFKSLLATHDTVAVCYPIYGSCVPRIMRDFVERHRAGFMGKKLIIFCTQMMFSGDGARAFLRLLPECEEQVIYAEHFNMPNNISNFWLFPIGDRERNRKKRRADRKLRRVCREIREGIVRKRGFGHFPALLGKVQNSSWYAVEKKQSGSFSADEGCVGCGLCVKRCPVKNLSLQGEQVIQHNRCILCYRCVNLCPKKAATVLLRVRPKRQYKGVS